MKNRFQHAIAASALLALGFAASPAFAGVAAEKITSYVEIARSVFGNEKTSADVVAATLAAAADKGVDAQGTVGELAAALSAAEVAKDDPAVADALAEIVNAVNDSAGDSAADFASRAAATVAAVTGLDSVSEALADPDLATAAVDPDSVLSGEEKADLKDLYEKVLAALKGAGYVMKEDDDKVVLAPGAGEGDENGDDAEGGDDADGDSDAEGGDDTAGGSDAEGGDDTAGGSDAEGGDDTAGGSDAEGGDDDLGDPLDQTIDNPYEFHVPPTTLSGVDPLVPAVTPTTKPPKHTRPSPTPVGLR